MVIHVSSWKKRNQIFAFVAILGFLCVCAPNYPIPPEGEWDLVFVWFHLPYYYTRSSSSKGWSDFTLLLKLSQ